MAFCPNCGNNVPDGTPQCPRCGVYLAAPPQPQYQQQAQYVQPNQYPPQNPYPPQNQYPPQPQYQNPYAAPFVEQGSGRLNVGMLIWSIVIMLFSFIFGLIALIMTISAKDEVYAQNERKKIKTAMILNIIGSVIAAFTVFYIIALFNGALYYGLMA